LSTNFSDESIAPTDWISQSEAARLRSVTRQAISKLIRKGRLRTLEIGGHTLVNRADVERFVQLQPGRPKVAEGVNPVNEIQRLLELCTTEQRQMIFQQLRAEFPIHSLETAFNAPADLILEAISRSPDISQRGVRDLIAEAAFELFVVKQLNGWEALPVNGSPAYDFLLQDEISQVSVQVKMQRRTSENTTRVQAARTTYRPMIAREASRNLPSDMYVVETQRTRTGKSAMGENTRPYRFDEFDILAVSMHPATNDWSTFMYTVARWLLPRSDDMQLLQIFQPVAMSPNEHWTDHFETCVAWWRSGRLRGVASDAPL
jgi:excisionase family DNA binding protein